SEIASDSSPTHIYTNAGTFIVTLTAVGKNGIVSKSNTITVSDACSNATFKNLTDCNSKDWKWSSDADAIKIINPANESEVWYSGPPESNCQSDDIITFKKDGSFVYNASGKTFSSFAQNSCVTALGNATKYKMLIGIGNNLPKIFLDSTTAPVVSKAFIGVTDYVPGYVYTIKYVDSNKLVLRAKTATTIIECKFVKSVALSTSDLKLMLTGLVSKNWKLSPGNADAAVIVGIEAEPAKHYAGGALVNCQLDDIYTFFADGTISYNANGATFNGGNISPNYNCGLDRSYTKKAITYSSLASGVAGIFQFTLAGTPDGTANSTFIGTTDITNNTFRVISITNNTLVLRTTNGTNANAVTHQFKFVTP
ncbi:MAG: hypothetical protein ORN58_06700, partial [Sediminibacterium sp.]|nr:hypothetical protein [Sediminibacterium sp.]